METQEIWQRYAAELKQFITNRVGNTAIADDLLQETFIKIHAKHDDLRQPSKLRAWVYSIVRHVVIDYFRHKSFVYDSVEDIKEEDTPPLNHSEKDCLKHIIDNLPKHYQQPLILSDIQGLKQQDIADILQRPLPTIKSQIQRARTLVAKGFMDCCGFKMNAQGYLVGELKDKANCKVCHQVHND